MATSFSQRADGMMAVFFRLPPPPRRSALGSRSPRCTSPTSASALMHTPESLQKVGVCVEITTGGGTGHAVYRSGPCELPPFRLG
jgi:hypothetical protein